jgi:hypothetical protein
MIVARLVLTQSTQSDEAGVTVSPDSRFEQANEKISSITLLFLNYASMS